MMTDEELDALYENELNIPYSDEELKFHQRLRVIKSWLEIAHAHNYDLIHLVFATEEYLFHGGPKPERKLWAMLRPGNNNDNAACARIHDIARFFGQYEHGATPRFPIVIYASRSTLSLVNVLEDFFFHESISDLNHHAKEFFCLIAHEGERRMSREEFARTLKEEGDAFIDAMTEYSKALCKFTHEREAEMREGRKAVLVEIKQPAKVNAPRKKSNNLGRGPQTNFKLMQRQTFLAYLKHHPVTPSQSVITLAHKCWIEHQAEWDVAARSGEGYFDYKKLARAI